MRMGQTSRHHSIIRTYATFFRCPQLFVAASTIISWQMPSSTLLPLGTQGMVPTATPSAIKMPQGTRTTEKSMQHSITSPSMSNLAALLRLRLPVLKETNRFRSRPTAIQDFLERGKATFDSGNARTLCTHLSVFAMLNAKWITQYRRMEQKLQRINTTKS